MGGRVFSWDEIRMFCFRCTCVRSSVHWWKVIIFRLSAGEAYMGFELQWNARTQPLKLWNSSDSCTNLVALVFFFFSQMSVSLQKSKGFLIIHLNYTCMWPISKKKKKKNHTKYFVKCESLVAQSTSFAKLSALSSDPFPFTSFCF